MSERPNPHKYWHYLFVVSALAIIVSVLALLNSYLGLNTTSSYSTGNDGVSSPLLLAGYLGMFLTIFVSPVPDYFLVPIYGYLSSTGSFDPYLTFLVCMVAATLPIEYAAGRFAGRPLLLKSLSYVRITEKDIRVADDWLIEHGRFSIFTCTFIPFFYSVASLAAGTLKMRAGTFLVLSVAGFGVRFAFLEYVGYSSIDLFTASFDYSQRFVFFAVLLASFAYMILYFCRTLGPLWLRPARSSKRGAPEVNKATPG